MKVANASANAAGQKKEMHPRPKLALDSVFKKTRTGLEFYQERPGDGPKIEEGAKVKVHYEGWLAEDYKLFDSSRKKRKPFEFEFGRGDVIAGWEEALKDIREGTKLQIKIPAKLAYGAQGIPQLDIPPNADLIFKVEVLKVEQPETAEDRRSSGFSRIA
ncbi:MAG: FKBP-type peptidyl-prolyl cis-trans isomerase [bacterium]|jgi:FKBP-type peptidyl-prolyl cis-trans isomerase